MSARRSRALRLQAVFAPSVAVALVLACGSRSGLLAPEEPADAEPADVKADHHDAGVDVSIDVAEEDAPLPIADAFPDTPIVTDCPDAGETLVYVIGAKNELYSFFPPTLAFTGIGTIACKSKSSPFSMAVTRSGIAFSIFADGNLFEISTANAACKATTYVPNQDNISNFGMGYAGNADGGETLYVAEQGAVLSPGLGFIDTTAFTLGFVGGFSQVLHRCELSGTGDGHLYGFCVGQLSSDGSMIVEIDPSNANVLSEHALTVGSSNSAFAFAYWGGKFWIFTSPGGGSTVTEYDPIAQTETNVATAPLEIVGAGVSTCAPQ